MSIIPKSAESGCGMWALRLRRGCRSCGPASHQIASRQVRQLDLDGTEPTIRNAAHHALSAGVLEAPEYLHKIVMRLLRLIWRKMCLQQKEVLMPAERCLHDLRLRGTGRVRGIVIESGWCTTDGERRGIGLEDGITGLRPLVAGDIHHDNDEQLLVFVRPQTWIHRTARGKEVYGIFARLILNGTRVE